MEGKMAEKSIIIIGAGLAGLSTGCYAQMNGYHTQIFEHHTMPGGVCTAWKRKGYTIDGCIAWLMGHKPGHPLYRFYSELGTAQANRFFDVTSYAKFIDEASGCSVEITTDLDNVAHELKAISPADSKVVDELIAGSRAMQKVNWVWDKPPELSSLFDKLGRMWRMRGGLKYFSKYMMSSEDFVKQVEAPFLRQVIMNLFQPETPVVFLMMILGCFSAGDCGTIEGGSLNFVLPIEKRYKELGGQVTYKSTVEEILVENDHAAGVRLADGSTHRADIVVSAADGYSTIFKMLGGRYVNEKIKKRYEHWPIFRPLVMVSFGVAREFSGEPSTNIILLQQPFNVGNQTIDAISVRIFNYDTTLAPPSKTVVQVVFESEFEWWERLQTERPRYDAEKERVAADVLERLEARYPGISSQVEMTDVATPYTTWRYTLNHKGTYEGWLFTPEAFRTSVEKTLPGLANFYMAGQWVQPGGGVPTVIMSGREVIQIICHQDKKRFSTSSP
jgi:phytoene dehydrogenase-like protein